MTNRTIDRHLGAETLQGFLEGDLSPREHTRVEEHLAACARCSAEMDAWKLLFDDLGSLPTLAPHAGFAERVLASVRPAEELSWAARLRALVGLGTRRAAHPGDERLQDFVDGTLPTPQAARVRAHVDACGTCADQVAIWRSLASKLGSLERRAPADGFADEVMARVRIPVPAARPAALEWRRALAWAGRVLPHTRRAWAAICGVAVTPVTTVGLVLWTVFTHPALTPGALASFVWWKASALTSTAWAALTHTALESEGLFGVYSFLASLVHSPAALVAAFLFFSLGTVAAAWVLYRNLVPTHQVEGRYAHASLS